MKALRLAFLYNVRHSYPDANDPRTQLEADFDDPPVILTIIKHLRACGFKVVPIEANEHALEKLRKHKKNIDLAFNFSEGIYGQDRECHFPAILELLQIPYLGCTPLTAALILNKARTKEVLQVHGVPTLPFQLFESPTTRIKPGLRFPLIVKPCSQGSSAGITNKSVVRNTHALTRQLRWAIKTFNQPALVEPFLDGREFSIAMLGNPPRLLPFIEARHDLLPTHLERIDSLEVKWFFEEEMEEPHLRCPAKVSSRLKKRLTELCHGTWKALGIRDWCRIDIRCDRKENPYVLEVNSPAGLIPPEHSVTSYFPMAARAAGLSYQSLLKAIVHTAWKRY